MTSPKLTAALLCILLCFFGYSCTKEKEEKAAETQPVSSNKITLHDLKTSQSEVQLSWTKLDTSSFREYVIIRKDNKNTPIGNMYSPNLLIIARISDPNTTYYVDADLPYAPYLEYQVVGVLSTGSYYKDILSNSKSFERPNIKIFSFSPLDVLPDIQNDRLYILEQDSGWISVINYETGTITKSIKTNAKIGFGDMGMYNNQKELYVPRNDGWVYVYNAETLEQKDQINAGSASSSVVFNNNKLFVSTADRYWPNRPLKVIDRTTKSLIATAGDNEQTRIKLIPNTNSELIEITINLGPTDLTFFRFDNNGLKLTEFEDRYHGDYPLDHQIFQIMPNGQEFISSQEGVIYSKDLVYKLRLPHGTYKYSDFAFNQDGSKIYASCSNEKLVISYSAAGYTELKKYETKGYPYRIFRKNNTLICLSRSTKVEGNFFYGKANFFIEKINLD